MSRPLGKDQKRNKLGQIEPENGPREPDHPLSAAESQTKAQKYAPEALDRLRSIMRSPKSAASAKVAAANAILDRAYGRPAQAVELADRGAAALNTALAQRVGRLSDEQLSAEIVKAERRAQLAALRFVVPPADGTDLEH